MLVDEIVDKLIHSSHTGDQQGVGKFVIGECLSKRLIPNTF
jgi:hypothetical protein